MSNKTSYLRKMISSILAFSKLRLILIALVSLNIFLFIFYQSPQLPQTHLNEIIHINRQSLPVSLKAEPPQWLELIRDSTHLTHQGILKVGMINFDINDDEQNRESLSGYVKSFKIIFEHISRNLTWDELLPRSNNEKMGRMYPKIPMPDPRKYPRLDLVVAQLPCGSEARQDKQINISTESRNVDGIRDVLRLQVSLATAYLLVENGISINEDVYVMFSSKCEPMIEIFRCDDLILHEGDYWIYEMNVEKLRERIGLPMGINILDLAPPNFGALGSRQLQAHSTHTSQASKHQLISNKLKPRHAYVTVLHSSESYVCGAIALAQSILLTNTTKDLVLLADHSISNHSITGLRSAGWTIKFIERIKSPYAKPKAYNLWNYSKLRIWQLTEYDKVMFIDSDFIVLQNIDHFFDYPQLSATPNNKWRFNSGIMLLEPSECLFNTLMNKRYELKSYNGGDQGYLNEIFTFWHKISRNMAFMKYVTKVKNNAGQIDVTKDHYTVHFLGMKPWTCYRDYDCNWDRKGYQKFASDNLHWRWWNVYDAMPKKLQMYCRMTKKQDYRLRKSRNWAKRDRFSDRHWKIKIKDPRRFKLISSS